MLRETVRENHTHLSASLVPHNGNGLNHPPNGETTDARVRNAAQSGYIQDGFSTDSGSPRRRRTFTVRLTRHYVLVTPASPKTEYRFLPACLAAYITWSARRNN